MPSDLELSIYRTLAYFDYFKYPLSSFEIWKWLLNPTKPTTLAEVVETLRDSAWLQARVNLADGLFAIGDAKAQVRERRRRFLDAGRKFHKVEKVLQLLARLPWLRGLAVCNSLAWHYTGIDSDIDLFLVTTPGRTWSARLLSTLPLKLLRQRPGEQDHDPLCLSFFCADTALQFEKLKIGPDDPYLAYWCRSLVPMVDHSGWLEAFERNNAWLQTALPNATFVRRAARFRDTPKWRLPRVFVSEKLAKQAQLERFPESIRTLMNLDTRVVVTDDILKFHDQDRRTEILNHLNALTAGL